MTVNVEDISSKAMVAIDGASFDWSYMADEEVPTNLVLWLSQIQSLDKLIGSQISDNNRKGVGYNVVPPLPTGLFAPPTIDLSNSGLKEFQQPEFEGYGFKENKGVCENSSNEIKKTTDALIIEDWVSDCDEDESEVRIEEMDIQEQDKKKAKNKQSRARNGKDKSTRKRPGRRLKMKAIKKSKRQKTDSNLEEEEQLKAFLMIVHDEEAEINYEVLNRRADGSSRYIKTFTEMVSRFDRLEFIELHSLVMKRFETSTPEGIDLIMWGSLRTMFEANAEDDLWKNKVEWILKSWNFYDNYGVHILVLEDGTKFYMLAERRYPLTKETLERMLDLRLLTESESEVVFDLLRFIQQQIDESGSHDGTLAIPEQTATGKEISNPFMADWKPKNAKDDKVTKEFKFIKEQIKE
ncbi:hypothetical protein Tco_0954837 [Tanacetum coccineum]|uniref:Uncharacterized protein n=1 Tax=Tanacetum coccineum TaxID=301880 RepID=A0ABQ5E5I1_9ASTR